MNTDREGEHGSPACIALPEQVTLVEVSPRDGLQNLATALPVSTRIALIEKLARAGLGHIEAGSFVSPEKVPQMAGSDRVLQAVTAAWPECTFPVLTPNRRGLDDAMAAGATRVAVFGSASETFCRKNINCSVAESLARFRDTIQAARNHHISVRGYLSCVAGCPYEGHVPYEKTASLAQQLLDAGCDEISLGDTTGRGTPGHIRALLGAVLKVVPVTKIAAHFHDTCGQALANIYVALQHGVSTIDSAVAGLGGCPYAPGASGNVATEDVVYMLHGLHIKTGTDLNHLIHAGAFICEALQCKSGAKTAAALGSRIA